MMVTRPVVGLEYDPVDRVWLAIAEHDDRIHTWGRNIGEVQRNALEALALWESDEEAEFGIRDVDWRIRFTEGDEPVDLTPGIQAVRKAREASRRMDGIYSELLERVVGDLTDRGLSYSEVGSLLGVSRQRVGQIRSGKADTESALRAPEEAARSIEEIQQDISQRVEALASELGVPPPEQGAPSRRELENA